MLATADLNKIPSASGHVTHTSFHPGVPSWLTDLSKDAHMQIPPQEYASLHSQKDFADGKWKSESDSVVSDSLQPHRLQSV